MSSFLDSDVSTLVEHLFRHEYGRMLATLVRIFGPSHIDLAEDVVQEAMIAALKRWPTTGIPDNPTAWLLQVAKHRALDAVRRERALAEREDRIRETLEHDHALSPAHVGDAGELPDDQLRMIFMCSHPSVPLEGRIALTLKTVCGFGVSEIARAFLAEESAIYQRLVRAKSRIRSSDVPFAMPEPAELPSRMDAVLEVLYLTFNEGHTASAGDDLVRVDLCREAIRLASLLAEHPATREPRVDALLALFLFHGARLTTRTDGSGDLVLLTEQDRARWDRGMIARGLFHLARSASGSALTAYHLEAEIASCHAIAPSLGETDWARIVRCYDALLRVQPSPLVALNRAIAVAELEGTEAGLRALDEIDAARALDGYYLLPAARGELLSRCGRRHEAADAYRLAVSLAPTPPLRRFAERRLAALRGLDAPSDEDCRKSGAPFVQG